MQDGKGTALFPARADWCHATDPFLIRGNPNPQETLPQNSIYVRSDFISIVLTPHFLFPVPQHAEDFWQGICLPHSMVWTGVPTNPLPKHSIYPQKGLEEHGQAMHGKAGSQSEQVCHTRVPQQPGEMETS